MSKRKRKVVVISDDEDARPSYVSSVNEFQKEISPFKQIEKELAFLNVNQQDQKCRNCGEVWSDKYHPKTLNDLAVNSKKVTEVRTWLEAQLDNPMGMTRVLILAGPPGVGKKALVRVLAQLMNVDLCEWLAPTPLLWNEHLHNFTSGLRYSSKLDDFVSFLDNTRRYPSLQGSQGKKKAILVDDLPLVSGDDRKEQLSQALLRLVAGASFPVILSVTEFIDSGGGGGGEMNRYLSGMVQALERAGARKVAINPATVNSIKKVLNRILNVEQYAVPNAVVAEIAQSVGGDVRHAIMSLQYVCIGKAKSHIGKGDKKRRKRKKCEDGDDVGDGDLHVDADGGDGKSAKEIGRDDTLTLFHALGKILHNKRDVDANIPEEKPTVREEYRRHPLKMTLPEAVIAQAHAEASTLMCFLQENVVEFLDDEGSEDMASISEYLSDADVLVAKSSWHYARCSHFSLTEFGFGDSLQNLESAAASIAARGVLFANTHPAPRRWLTLRSPALWQVERSRAAKQAELNVMSSQSQIGVRVIASEYMPFTRTISSAAVTTATAADDAAVYDEDEIQEWD